MACCYAIPFRAVPSIPWFGPPIAGQLNLKRAFLNTGVSNPLPQHVTAGHPANAPPGPFKKNGFIQKPGQDFKSKMPKKLEGGHFLASWGIKSRGSPWENWGRFSQGLDPGPAQGLTWASPGLDPGQPRSIFWSRFWSNRTTETTAGTETIKGCARFARAPLFCCSECCCFCCSV